MWTRWSPLEPLWHIPSSWGWHMITSLLFSHLILELPWAILSGMINIFFLKPLPFHFPFLTPKELAGFNNMAKTLLDIVLLFFSFLMGIMWNRKIINSVLETVIELQRTTKSKGICNNPDMKKAIFPELKIYNMK